MRDEKVIPQIETYSGGKDASQKRIEFYSQRIYELKCRAKAEEASRKKADRIGGAV